MQAKFPLSALLAVAQCAFAINNVAVLELLPSESVSGIIRIEESRHLTDELRKQAVTALPKGEYSVLTRDNIIALIPPDEKEAQCLAESCAVDIGRAIGAEYVTQGTIGRFADELTISVELYETMGGKLLSSIVFESKDISGLLNAIRSEAGSLFQGIAASRGSAAVPPAKASPAARGDAPGAGTSASGGIGIPRWIGIGLAAAGLGAGIYGFMQNSRYNTLHDDFANARSLEEERAKESDSKEALRHRNLGYTIGSALLAGGITLWIVF